MFYQRNKEHKHIKYHLLREIMANECLSVFNELYTNQDFFGRELDYYTLSLTGKLSINFIANFSNHEK